MSAASSSSSSELKRSITLRRGVPTEYVEGRTQGYRLRYDVTEAQLVAPEIFVYQRKPGALPGATPIDEFSNVASPADLEEYPTDAPETGGVFFRLSYADLIYRNLELLQESADALEQDVQLLLNALAELDVLTEQCVTITGDYEAAPPAATTIRIVAETRDPTVDDDITLRYGIGSWWINTLTGSLFVLVDNTNGAAVWDKIAAGVFRETLSRDNKWMAALATSADGDLATNTALVAAPAVDGDLEVVVNATLVQLGDGVKTTECYFSTDAGVTALAKADLVADAKLYWNGSKAGYELAVDDVISFRYMTHARG